MGHLQPSRVTSRVTSSQKWQTSSPPVTFVRNRVLYVKFLPKFSARAARSLAMQIRKSHPESHPWKIQRTQVTSDHIQESHPGKIQRPVTSEWSHPQSHPDKIQSLPGAHPMGGWGLTLSEPSENVKYPTRENWRNPAASSRDAATCCSRRLHIVEPRQSCRSIMLRAAVLIKLLTTVGGHGAMTFQCVDPRLRSSIGCVLLP